MQPYRMVWTPTLSDTNHKARGFPSLHSKLIQCFRPPPPSHLLFPTIIREVMSITMAITERNGLRIAQEWRRASSWTGLDPTVTTPRPTVGRPINTMIEIDPPLRPTNTLCSITTTVARHNPRPPPKVARGEMQCISIFNVSVCAIGFTVSMFSVFDLINGYLP